MTTDQRPFLEWVRQFRNDVVATSSCPTCKAEVGQPCGDSLTPAAARHPLATVHDTRILTYLNPLERWRVSSDVRVGTCGHREVWGCASFAGHSGPHDVRAQVALATTVSIPALPAGSWVELVELELGHRVAQLRHGADAESWTDLAYWRPGYGVSWSDFVSLARGYAAAHGVRFVNAFESVSETVQT